MSAPWTEEAALRSAAYHESGHCVVASLNGWTVEEVAIYAPGSHPSKGGQCCLYEHDVEAAENPFKYAAYLFAGGEAERRAIGVTPADGQDRKQALALASVTLNAEPDSPRVAAWLDAGRTLAAAKLADDRVWGWVERVASALLTRRRLTGADVHALCPRGQR